MRTEPGSCPCSAAGSCAIRRRSNRRSRSWARRGWRRAAAFHDGLRFDAFWDRAGTAFRAPFSAWDEADVRNVFFEHHSGLLAFYTRAAARGDAVIKAFWY
ncbi:hypothetical protein GLX30_14380 [Streptomyces sp. Tu 2975]|uniref:hypothetical protein n=1 Tax=Streptomyces sp. Tu 2975 TaxID=2676871 RepID=UPI00135AC711|nr:hypothetical protein [Streptomyces sp. Tu 2975]QIP85015.1 hypothetical protein GLX30_14380 [Streptomyces sp. Tu 2975]